MHATPLCRYGWIDGQNVIFLPHFNGPNCDSSSTEITFRPEAADYLSDVYCFNPSGESIKTMGYLNEKHYENKHAPNRFCLIYFLFPSYKDASLNCDDTGKSNSEGLTNGNTATASKFPLLFPAVPRIGF